MFRYVCPKCLRTFLADEYHEDWICWKCGELTEVIPKKTSIEILEDDREDLDNK